MRSHLACLAILFLFATPGLAIDLATNAHVVIVEGIAISQTTALNFGVIARNSGTLTIGPSDGAAVDPDNLVIDATDLNQGVFSVDSQTGANLVVSIAAGAMPAGLTLSAFMADWGDAGAPSGMPSTRTLLTDIEVLEIGATLTVDRTTVALTGGTPANLPYTVSVTYQ